MSNWRPQPVTVWLSDVTCTFGGDAADHAIRRRPAPPWWRGDRRPRHGRAQPLLLREAFIRFATGNRLAMSVSVQVRRYGGRFDGVLFDRDGTLVRDIPYNGDPDRVEPMPGAADAVTRLRAFGYRLGVVSNQSGIGRGLLDAAAVARVNARID